MLSIWPQLEHNDSDPYWASPGLVDSGRYMGIIGTWILSYIPGPHLDLVTVVSPGPHLDELTLSHRDLLWTW